MPPCEIVAERGFTLGVFCGRYKTKEDLTSTTCSISHVMDKLPPESKPCDMVGCHLDRLPDLIDFIRALREEMTLLVRCSAGTRNESFPGDLQARDEHEMARLSGAAVGGVERPTCDLLMSGYFNMLGSIMLKEYDSVRIRKARPERAIVHRE